MRYNIDLVTKKDEITELPKVEVKDRMSDPFLVYKIATYGDTNYEEIKKVLLSNPFLYESKKLDSFHIKTLDEFCFISGNRPISLGGLIISKEYTKSEKKQLLNQCLITWANDYRTLQNETIKGIDNQLSVIDRTRPKHIKILTIIIIAFITTLLFLFSFPTAKLLEINHLGPFLLKIQEVVKNNKASNIFRYISLITSLITLVYAITYNILTIILQSKYDSIFENMTYLTKVVGKIFKKSFKKIKRHYHKMLRINSEKKYKAYQIDSMLKKKYQLSNIEKISKKSIEKFSMIKKTIKTMFYGKWILYGISIISIIIYVILLII